ncbi:MAG: (2Fe-2S) ferredoxin domain-containing protein [Parcubacteria group bacterium]|nr:(2Fe-2S) ferredoxin domain-containing protein [Parcubacteria group bacterium]
MPEDLRIAAPTDFRPVAEPWYDQGKDVVKVCHGFTCGKRQAKGLLQTLKQSLTGQDVQVVACPCTGNCKKSNNVVVNRQILHWQLPERVAENVKRELAKQQKEKDLPTGGMTNEEADHILGL